MNINIGHCYTCYSCCLSSCLLLTLSSSYLILFSPVNIQRLSRDSCEPETSISVLFPKFSAFNFHPQHPLFFSFPGHPDMNGRPHFTKLRFTEADPASKEGTINTLCKEIKFKYPERNKSAARRERRAGERTESLARRPP